MDPAISLAEHTVNRAPMDLMGRNLTQWLNDERNVEFKLRKTRARIHAEGRRCRDVPRSFHR